MTDTRLIEIKESIDKLSKTIALTAIMEASGKTMGNSVFINKQKALKELINLHDLDRVVRS